MTLRMPTLMLTLLLTGCSGCGNEDSDSANGSGTSGDLVDSWKRDANVTIDGMDVEVYWEGFADASCHVEMVSTNITVEFDGSYTASGGEFTMVDQQCTVGEGSYSYSLVGDQVTFTLIDDPCETRRELLASSWTRL